VRAPRGRVALQCALVAGLVGAASASAAEAPDQPRPRWLVEAEARVGGNATVGPAREIIREALDLGVGAAARREGSPWRWRAGLTVEPLTDVGPGASLQIFRARAGVERDWRRHVVTAVELGGALRRISIDDEITRSTLGIDAGAELGWRSFLGARWSLTASVRSSTTWFVSDLVIWQELGVSLTLGRRAGPP
jgi:hypothetical protein